MAGPKFRLAALFVTRGARSLRSSRLAIRNFRLGRYPHILLANRLPFVGDAVPRKNHTPVVPELDEPVSSSISENPRNPRLFQSVQDVRHDLSGLLINLHPHHAFIGGRFFERGELAVEQ